MEALIELVAASLARHGIDCPEGVPRPMWRPAISPVQASMPLSEPTALPEHSYRKKSEGDPAP
ncbi:MAG: hypothetical protein WAL71_19840 [Terriglobales bacterium]